MNIHPKLQPYYDDIISSFNLHETPDCIYKINGFTVGHINPKAPGGPAILIFTYPCIGVNSVYSLGVNNENAHFSDFKIDVFIELLIDLREKVWEVNGRIPKKTLPVDGDIKNLKLFIKDFADPLNPELPSTLILDSDRDYNDRTMELLGKMYSLLIAYNKGYMYTGELGIFNGVKVSFISENSRKDICLEFPEVLGRTVKVTGNSDKLMINASPEVAVINWEILLNTVSDITTLFEKHYPVSKGI